MPGISRRRILTGSAASVATCAVSRGVIAATPPAKTQGPGVYRLKLGNYQVTALYDGLWPVKLDDDFIRNASRSQVDKALTAAFLAPGILPISFTALLVNTGSKLILIDTGTAGQITDSAGTLPANLALAGVSPKEIDTIVISHFHPDHINGIKTKDGAKVFPNAEIMVPEPEWQFWMNDANLNAATGTVRKYFLNARRIFRDLVKDVHRFTPGAEVAPGITSLAAYGHTPGHCAFTVSSGQASMLVLSDSARDPALFVRHPDWQPSFDMDGGIAVETRRALLDRAAADRLLVHGYHFPFPACGHIAKVKRDFELVPVQWQPL
ncbi:MAG: MBL fold metallo-hydrolase [Pseudolabrys sp.]|nr:MBL fold metallo-hydrolase [Pseudolabrys sp.]